jgi:PAS domain S-box-containing protein
LWAGLLFGLLAFPLNTLLLRLVADAGWDVVAREGGIPASIAVALIGALVGQLRDLSEQAKQELAERKRAEEQLQGYATELEEISLQRQHLIEEKERTLEALQVSEERFKTLFEFAPDAYYLNDLKGNFVDGNRAAEEMTGYSRSELIGNSFLKLKLLPAQQIPRAVSVLARNALGQPAGPDEFMLNRKDGGQVAVEIRTYPVEIEGQALVLGLARDITERKQAEAERERLLAAEREQRLLAETLTDVTLALTSQVSHEVVLDEILRQTRRIVPYDAANIALVEGDFLRIVRWQGYQAFGCEEFIAHLMQSLTEWPLDERVIRSRKPLVIPDTRREPRWTKLEETAWVRSYLAVPICLRDRTLGLLRLDSAIPGRFIPEHARRLQPLASAAAIAIENIRLVAGLEAEVEARTAEIVAEQEKSEAILHSVGDAILMTDRDMRVRYVNPAFTALTGYTAEEVLGQSVSSVGTETPSEQVEQAKRLALASGELWQGEERGRRKDGRIYEAAVTIAPLRDPEGHLMGYVYSHRDITQRKHLDRARSRFVTNVSHQLRTPVTTIQLYTHLLQEGRRPGKARDYLHVIKAETDRLAHLIRDIIELTALDSGKAVTVWQSVSLPDLLDNLVTRYQDQAQASGLTLTCGPLPPDWPAIRGDRARLAQALQELVENAILFTPPGGQVALEVETVEDEEQFWVTVAVRDTGPGISVEEQERIFDRFYRGRLAESGHTAGTGLGLSIVDEILRAHGGKVTVESVVGEGSMFRIWLVPQPHEISLPQGHDGEPAGE